METSFSADYLESGSRIQKENAKFQKVFDSLVKQMWEAQQSNDLAEYSNFISGLASERESWANVRDHHGRTVLHKAVENGNIWLEQMSMSKRIVVQLQNKKCGHYNLA